MNNYLSNAEDAMNTTISNETALKTQSRRKKMEKGGNNQGKGKLHPEKKDQGMIRQSPHSPRNKETNQK
jgi:hypothetical protein